MNHRARLLTLLLIFAAPGFLAQADEATELRHKAKQLLKTAEEAARAGHPEEAKRLEEEAQALRALAEKHQSRGEVDRPEQVERQIAELKERLEALLGKQRKLQETGGDPQSFALVREQIGDTERALKKLRSIQERGPRDRDPGQHPSHESPSHDLEQAERKAHHLRIAAENLELAGERDLAHKLREQSEQFVAKIRREREQREKAHAAREAADQQGVAAARQIAELREEIERLRSEIRELREKPARPD